MIRSEKSESCEHPNLMAKSISTDISITPVNLVSQPKNIRGHSRYFWDHPSFCLLVIGSIGAGKTTLIESLFVNEGSHLWGKFHFVFFFTNSPMKGVAVKEGENWYRTVDINFLDNILGYLDEIVKRSPNEEVMRALFVLDDQAMSLSDLSKTKFFNELLLNRRHISMDQIQLSFIISSQRYTKVLETTMRHLASACIYFPRRFGQDHQSVMRDLTGRKSNLQLIVKGIAAKDNHGFLYVNRDPTETISIGFDQVIPVELYGE